MGHDSNLDGNINYRYTRTFNELGQITSNTRDIDFDGTIDYAIAYTFDDAGNEMTFDQDRDGGGVDFSRHWVRDAEGNPLQQRLDRDGDGSYDSTIEYQYDGEFNLVQITYYEADTTSPVSITYNTYGSNGIE